MKRKIFISICLIVLITIVLSSTLVSVVMYNKFYTQMKNEVKLQAIYISSAMNLSGDKYLSSIHSSASNRITLISPNGTVLYDSQKDPSSLENHSNRQEVKLATKEGWGESVRFSSTLGKQTFYYAKKLDNGSVLRVASTVSSVFKTLSACIPFLILIIIVVFLMAVAISNIQTIRILKPINELDLENPLKNEAVYDELSPLLTRILNQKRQIDKQLYELDQKQQEFRAITENMREGLVVLGKKSNILSINRSAIAIFGVKDLKFLNHHILSANRSLSLLPVIEKSLNGIPSEIVLSNHNGKYQFIANPVKVDNEVKGTVLLILDVTEKQAAEQIRKEFSANVSHELKTPLTSISGYAEIMKNGLVKNEDITKFAGRIYDETNRLISLIEDIIKVSRLDENNTALEKENINLLELSKAVTSRLTQIANKKQISINVTGSNLTVLGIPQILEEMVYNLCDNAIKYNVPNGTVDINVTKVNQNTVFSITDSGIGIPLEHQDRVFERFYRVDKSHSKETGGTGLGLSIVKHGAILHNAKIELTSQPNLGTTIKLIF